MFDIGFLELLIIGIVALIVVGPKDLPGMFRTAGQFMGRMRGMAREFQRSMEEAADQSGVKEAAKGLRAVNDLGLNSATKSAKSYANSILKDGDSADATAPKPDPGAPAPPAAAARTAADTPADTPADTAAETATQTATQAATPKPKPDAAPTPEPAPKAEG
ncbi:MAG: Sec-independent protein translocase protein TatB [Pseudomonadota bacterium]